MKKQSGAGLIEALVAILVLSIGLMGMIGMQTASFRYDQTSWARSALSNNISGLIDRIRANPESLPTAYSFSRSYADERASILGSTTYFTPATNCDTTDCTAAQRAAYDLVVWRQALNQQMPGSAGFVVPAGTRNVDLRYRVTIVWFDKNNLEDDTDGNLAKLIEPKICDGSEIGIAARNCCPTFLGSSSALAGARCTNMELIP